MPVQQSVKACHTRSTNVYRSFIKRNFSLPQTEIPFAFFANSHCFGGFQIQNKMKKYPWVKQHVRSTNVVSFECSCATPFPSLCGYIKQGSSVWAIALPVSTHKVLSGLLTLGGVKCLRLFYLEAIQKHEAIVFSTGNYKVNPAHTWIFWRRGCHSWYVLHVSLSHSSSILSLGP